VALRVTAAAATLALFKAVVGVLTGSLALLSSALDSIGDALASGVNFVFLTIAAKPPDSDHPFGHGKAENLAALFEGVVMLTGSIILIVEAVRHIVDPKPVHISAAAIVVMIISIIVSAVLTRYLNTHASREESSALEADALHYNSDVVANIATLASLIASRMLDLPMLDSIFAIVIAFWIAATALRLFWNAGNDLMERALPEAEVAAIVEAIEKSDPAVLGYDNLRTRRAAGVRFIEFELWIDRTVSFELAHEITERIKTRIRDAFPRVMIAVHTEPVLKAERETVVKR
jgi:cation diffusion facilitator family transporter